MAKGKKAKSRPTPVAKTRAPPTRASSVASRAKSAVSSLLGGKKGKGGPHKRVSAKMMLKKQYEARAKRQIRMGMLGQARRTLRKKALVV